MSRCELAILLDRPDATYRPGELIRGVVTVGVNATCHCDDLSIELQWRTHGRGNIASGSPNKVSLGTHEWSEGDTASHRFELIAPEGPVTYHGHFLNVDHYLVSRADIPWAIDPKAEAFVVLAPAPIEVEAGQRGYREGPRAIVRGAPGALVRSGSGSPAARFGCGGFFLFCTALSAWAASDGAVAAMVFSPLFLAASVALVVSGVRRLEMRQRLGTPDVVLTPPLPTRGDLLEATITLRPRATVTIRESSAKLLGQEIVKSGSGKHSTTHTHVLHSDEGSFRHSESRLPAHGEQVLRVSFRLPPDAAPSFEATDNQVVWSLALAIEFHDCPEWSEQFNFTVHAS